MGPHYICYCRRCICRASFHVHIWKLFTFFAEETVNLLPIKKKRLQPFFLEATQNYKNGFVFSSTSFLYSEFLKLHLSSSDIHFVHAEMSGW